MRVRCVVLGALLIGCNNQETVFPPEDVPPPEDVAVVIDVGNDIPAAPRDVGADAPTIDAGRPDVGTPDVGTPDVGPTSGISFDTSTVVTSGSVGGTGGTLFNDDCPSGAAMVGFDGTLGADNYITQIAVVCAALRVEGDRVRTGATTSLPRRGINPGSSVSARCPADQLLVGFEGRAGGLIDQLSLACAPYTVATTGGAGRGVRGTVTLTDPVGGGGGAAFTRISCSGDGAAQGAALRAGDGLDALGLRCASLMAR